LPASHVSAVTAIETEIPGGAVLYDGRLLDGVADGLFDPAWWTSTGRMIGPADGGRGTVFFLRAGTGEWALRHYQRGGLVGRVVSDRYLFSGAERTRSFREWRLLARLAEDGLPVPSPVAARYVRAGRQYTADLITLRIPGARPLSRCLAEQPLPGDVWVSVGECIRRFHDANVFHADLNAHNVLLDGSRAAWLLDFDRGRIREDRGWRRSNLERFLRSLNKIRAADPRVVFGRPEWGQVMEGYVGGAA
jgi:3-deoxy-D-manno-octulosonic acid kinase